MAPSRGTKRNSATAFGSPKLATDGQTVLQRHRNGAPTAKTNNKNIDFDATTPRETHKREQRKQNEHPDRHNQPGLKQQAATLLATRKQLPIWSHASSIRAALSANDVLLLVGETGSGKSTQVPQFLVEERWCRRRRVQLPGGGVGKEEEEVGGCIAITQPRRVAAVSLAKRVAEEMGTTVGGKAGEVGYEVRFERRVGERVRVKFLTEGMLLMEMLRDPALKRYSCVVVDEVHERGVGVDLCLGFLRQLVRGEGEAVKGRGGAPLKVVVMSATADMEGLERFFDGNVNKKDEKEKQQDVSNGSVDGVKGQQNETWNGLSDDESSATHIATKVTSLRIPGRLHPVTVNYLPQPTPDIISAALDRITHIHTHSPLPGDVLVFLPGQETIESLLSLLTTYASTLEKNAKENPKAPAIPALLLLPLYAALPPHQQQLVFLPTPKFTRKIILSTNIAETSLTVPGVRHVIDSGLSKQRLFRPSLNIDSLLTTPISRSSAAQRAGRAGRDAPGTAWRLYTEKNYYELKQDTEPEVLRCDLSQLVLTLKAHGVKSLREWKMLSKPPKRGLERAFVGLLGIGALDEGAGNVTGVGKQMSLLPLPGNLARVLLASVRWGCVDQIVDIVASLSVENIFVNIHEGRGRGSGNGEESEDEGPSDPRLVLRSKLYRREGDHLTLLAAVQAYVEENSDRKRWCSERGISHRAMQGALDVRKQLSGILARQRDTSGSSKNGSNPPDGKATIVSTPAVEVTDLNTRILKCLLTGLHPNVARLASPAANATTKTNKKQPESMAGPPSYLTIATNQPVSIHPSSVLFGRRVEAVMSSEFVFTTKSYARCVSAVELGWVREAQEAALKDI
ncbi:uncharacterized protein HMPREF1541_05796 [Cyphellophora europaea CBS 101466]|uniref:RNA helicase n=1 Tax=Cyphellophora europaea (strain CBS 101466) TaxID=1220924 RepID=W2RTC6_CYPE1|nr:uncharacterized protein HMPREF1541_05796 [Cyphellophora europaea CBS 101466]ETN39570.1 hypothetical protein HMPREF1541_05796 [Cyphellophora europaea CBS 101466]